MAELNETKLHPSDLGIGNGWWSGPKGEAAIDLMFGLFGQKKSECLYESLESYCVDGLLLLIISVCRMYLFVFGR